MSSFAFGIGGDKNAASAPGAAAPAFSFPTAAPAAGNTTNASGTAAAPPSAFGGAATGATTATGGGFNLGGGTGSAASAPVPFSFGAAAGAAAAAAPSSAGSSSSGGAGAAAAGEKKDSSAPAPAAAGAFGGFSGFGGAALGSGGAVSSAGDKAAAPAPVAPPPAVGINFGAKPAEEAKQDAATTPATGFGGFPGAGAPKPAEGSQTAAAPGFALGTAAPKPAEEAKKSAAPTPPAAGGFNFSGAPATTPTGQSPTPAPAASTFSFAGTTPAAAPTTPGTPAPPTPGPPAPVATPGQTPAGGFPQTTTTSPASATAPKEPVNLQYQHLTVEQILNKFQQELEKDSVVYLEEARRVAEYDAILRDSQNDIASLTEQMQRCMVQQKEVEQTLAGIGNFQSELDRNLDAVEHNVDELFAAQSHLVPGDADCEREAAYQTANSVEQRLKTLEESLQSTLQQMDAAQERALTGDVAKIVQILNQHQNSLAALEEAGRRMEHDIEQVHRVLGQR